MDSSGDGGADRAARLDRLTGSPERPDEWSVSFGPAGSSLYRHEHVFEVIDRPRRLVVATTEFRADGASFDFTTEFTFADHQGRTLMTMIRTGFPAAELRDEHARGLANAFDRFERFIPARSAP